MKFFEAINGDLINERFVKRIKWNKHSNETLLIGFDDEVIAHAYRIDETDMVGPLVPCPEGVTLLVWHTDTLDPTENGVWFEELIIVALELHSFGVTPWTLEGAKRENRAFKLPDGRVSDPDDMDWKSVESFRKDQRERHVENCQRQIEDSKKNGSEA